MIILYDKNEQTFTSLGLGVLTDATSCLVIEELNGAFELEMEYPITGIHYKDILEERIIVAPPNDTMQPQPFRIYKITKPIDGIVTVYGQHISYDTSKVPVRAIAAENLDQVAEQMNSRKMVNSPFIFVNGKGEDNQTFLTKVPYSFRSLLAGTTGSILDKFGGEFIFDRYNITLVERRGTNRDFVIRYSKNMTDLEQETSTELMYDGVCPYYCNTITETKPSLAGRYKEIYISTSTVEPKKDAETGDTLYPSEWLTYNQNGIGIPEILSFAVTNIIANEGQFYNHLVRAKKTKAVGDEEEHDYFYDVTYNMSFIDRNYADEFGRYWLYKDEELTEGWDPEEYDNEKKYYKYRWNPEGLPIGSEPGQWDPEKNKDKIFRVYTQNDKLYKVYLWKFDETLSAYRYQEPADADKVNKYSPVLPSLSTVQEEKDNIILYEGDIIYVNEVRAQPSGLLVEEYGRYWLKEVKELLQILRTDPRWEAGEVIQPKKGVTYKVIQKEEYIQAYVIPGVKEYTSGWLTGTEGSDIPFPKAPNKYIDTYVIQGETEFTSTWLTNTPGGTTPLVPESDNYYKVYYDGMQRYYTWNSDLSKYEEVIVLANNRGYVFDRPSDGKTFYYRWNEFENKYVQITDTRYSYINYIWNGSRYVEKDTSVDAILTLDLSDKFKETPTDTTRFQKQLYEEAIKYIKENKIGQLKDSIKVSFIKLSQSEEYSKWKELEKVSLGDTVTIVFDEAGVNVQKKVCKTEYNVLKESYDTIELGDKASQFTNNAVVEGDDISSFTNNRNFTDVTTVTKLVAEVVTADLIQAVNAEITEAQIKTLTSESISATLIEAERFEIDKLVAGLLVAKDAYISEALTAGEVVVNGEINVRSGSISITGRTEEVATVKAYVNDNAQEYDIYWLKENPDSKDPLTPDKLVIYEVYEYYNKAELFIGYFKWNKDPEVSKYEEYNIDTSVVFEVDANGKLTANEVDVAGKITANSGDIGGCIIVGAPDEYIDAYVIEGAEELTSGWLTDTEGSTTPLTPQAGKYYRVDYDGMQRYYTWNSSFSKYVDELVGILQVDGANISGTLNAVNIVSSDISSTDIHASNISASDISSTDIHASTISSTDISASTIKASKILLSDDIAETTFAVDEKGNLKANAVELEGGTIENLTITGRINFGEQPEYATAYERVNGATSKTTMAYFGADSEGTGWNYKVVLRDFLIYSDLEYGRDYWDYWEDDSSDYTEFEQYSVLKIFVHKGGYISVSSSAESGHSNYNIAVNGITSQTYSGAHDSAIAEYDQYIEINMLEADNTYMYSIVIHDILRGPNWLSEYGHNGQPLTPQNEKIYNVEMLSGLPQTYTVVYYRTGDDVVPYSANWLSLTLGGAPYAPQLNEVCAVQTSPTDYVYYVWKGSVLEYDDYPLVYELWKYDEANQIYIEPAIVESYIDEDGIVLPGITATKEGSKIAGFTIEDNTMTSSTSTKEVGISSTESDEYAFWAGKEDHMSGHPFSVTHEGALKATKGHIANFVIDTNTIHTEEKNSIDSDKLGLYLGSDGFAYKINYNEGEDYPLAEIKLKASSYYGASYLKNFLLVHPCIPTRMFETDGSYSKSIRNSKPLIIRQLYNEDLILYHPVFQSSSGITTIFTIKAQSWQTINLRGLFLDGGQAWKKIYGVYASFVFENNSGNPNTERNLEVNWDNAHPHVIYVYNGCTVAKKVCVFLLAETELATYDDDDK